MESLLTTKGLHTRHKILEAATRVVARQGIENASVTAIATAARVSRTLVPYHLPPQDQLVVELIRYITEKGRAEFAAATPARNTSRLPAALEERIRRNFAFFSQHAHYFQCFMLFYYRCSYDRTCRELNQTITTAVVDTFEQALKSELPRLKAARRQAQLIYRLMNSSIQESFLMPANERTSASRGLDEVLEEIEILLGLRR